MADAFTSANAGDGRDGRIEKRQYKSTLVSQLPTKQSGTVIGCVIHTFLGLREAQAIRLECLEGPIDILHAEDFGIQFRMGSIVCTFQHFS